MVSEVRVIYLRDLTFVPSRFLWNSNGGQISRVRRRQEIIEPQIFVLRSTTVCPCIRSLPSGDLVERSVKYIERFIALD